MKACRIQRIQVKLDKYWALEKYNFTTTVLSSYIGSETDTDLRDVLDEILNLIESVSEDFPSYSYTED